MDWIKVIAVAACLNFATAAQGQIEGGMQREMCPHPKGWKPMDKDWQQMLASHQIWVNRWKENKLSLEWANQHPEGRLNLCNANLALHNLSGRDLFGAVLIDINLSSSLLTETVLYMAELNNASLWNADLSKANLAWAVLTGAELNGAVLKGAWLSDAQLNGADLYKAKLNGALLNHAKLNGAVLDRADLTDANLSGAELIEAKLKETTLTNAELERAQLNGAELIGTSLERAKLAYTDLTGAIYAPASPPPDAFVAGIKGLTTLTFPAGEEVGLVQLRKLLQEAGLRELEREATYAIESGRTDHALAPNQSNWSYAEGIVRFLAFDLTTAYGLHPGQALIVIFVVWALLIPVYASSIWHGPWQSDKMDGIYLMWPNDHVVRENDKLRTAEAPRVEHLKRGFWPAVRWGAFFSLLSAFHIGFRELSVGTWIARLQRDDYTLRALGWVRIISGLQSLLSVYLLALWILTYFGRPFE